MGDISTYAGYGGATTSTSAVDDGETTTYDVATLTTVSPPTYNFTTTSSLPLASGSLNNCYDTFENTYGDLVCVQFAKWYGVALSDFLRWNPSLDTNSTSMFDCVLQNNTAYCAAFYDNDGMLIFMQWVLLWLYLKCVNYLITAGTSANGWPVSLHYKHSDRVCGGPH